MPVSQMKHSMIGIIDYGMGNLRSVQKAFEALGTQATILTDPSQTADVQRLVLPGVGAFADGMTNLNERGWSPAIRDFIASHRPFLGICLGMQLLFDSSEEDAPCIDQPVAGLGILPGKVVQFVSPSPDGQRIKIPHMGWNQLCWDRDDPLVQGLSQDCHMYFVHSYYIKPDDNSLTTATSDYGQRFCATVWRDNIWATQFHPEKSQLVGLAMLRNFATHCDAATTAS